MDLRQRKRAFLAFKRGSTDIYSFQWKIRYTNNKRNILIKNMRNCGSGVLLNVCLSLSWQEERGDPMKQTIPQGTRAAFEIIFVRHFFIQWTPIFNAPRPDHPVKTCLVYRDDSWCGSLAIEMKNVCNTGDVNNSHSLHLYIKNRIKISFRITSSTSDVLIPSPVY